MDTPGLALFTHTLIIAEEGSRVTFLEEFASPSSETRQSFHSGLVEVFLGQGADVTYGDVQTWGPEVVAITAKRADVRRDATMRWAGAQLGTKLTHGRFHTALSEPGSTILMMGIFLATGRQHLDLDSYVDHIAPHTKGDVLYRGIIRDRARTIFQGLIKVEKQAQQTDSYLANHNLLLSPRARADSIPTLEIEANDVPAPTAPPSAN
jgi:Fe-S cluster assembly protein SufD